MSKRYIVNFDGSVAEITRPVSSVLVYRIPYEDLKKKKYPDIDNNFIVYILFGRNAFGKDAVYVGKSTNGMKNRPTSHEGKYDNWSTCFVLTQHVEKTFLNDGCIQYMEYMINERVRKDGRYVDTTDITNTGTANKSEQEDCNEYLEEAYDMLKVLGFDISEGVEKKTTPPVSPGKIIKCSLKRNVNKCLIEATMEIRSSGSYVVMPGSMVAEKESKHLSPQYREKRHNAKIKNGILQEEVSFGSPSGASAFVIGNTCDGWLEWRTLDGELLQKIRQDIAEGKIF